MSDTPLHSLSADLCIIGGGAAGLTLAAGASQLGASVILFDPMAQEGVMGGDCLHSGCVPSKAILACGHRLQTLRDSQALGLITKTENPKANFDAVKNYIKLAQSAIAPHDSVARFEKLGVTVIPEKAQFIDPTTIQGGNYQVTARKTVIATGAIPFIPPIPGLSDINYHTYETIFDLPELPASLMIMGGGPIGCELAQAFCQLGCDVTLIEMGSILPKDDPDLVDIVRQTLIEEGVTILEHEKVISASRDANNLDKSGEIQLQLESGKIMRGHELLVCTGRKPMIQGLGLDKADIIADPQTGIQVDHHLRTSNKRVYAAGDVTGHPQFTHAAGYQGGFLLQKLLFALPIKLSLSMVPWVTYTAPELAQIGLTETQARTEYGPDIQVSTTSFQQNDRANCEGHTNGLIKLVMTQKGKLLGVGIAGPGAGEMLPFWSLVLKEKIPLRKISGLIFPYPGYADINRQAVSAYLSPKFFSKIPMLLVRFLKKL